MSKCDFCGEEVQFPFICSYCGKGFCPIHRLPESHDCLSLPKGDFWYQRQKAREEKPEKRGALSFAKAEPIKPPSRKHSRFGELLSGRTRSIVSLKIWFPLFWGSVALVFFLEQGNPIQFYESVTEPARYFLYVFAGAVGLRVGYRIFLKCDVSPSSDRGIFGLKLLSFGVLVAAIFALIFGVSLLFMDFLISGSLFMEPQASLSREMASAFFIVLSLALIVLSGYLIFKFERRSGIIVYRR